MSFYYLNELRGLKMVVSVPFIMFYANRPPERAGICF